MLDFFTDPYPDELLLSSISRYHYYSGNKDYRDTNKELYGKRIVDRVGLVLIDLSNNLGGTYTKEDLLYNNTLFPYYDFFKGLYSFEDFMCIDKQLFFCPECLKEDLKNYGEVYFHREHQIKDILICPKHRTLLMPYLGQTWTSINKYNKFDINSVKLNDVKLLDESKFDKLWQVSMLASELLSSKTDKIITFDVLNNYYKILLYKKGFINSNGFIIENFLEKEIINFYGDEILNILDQNYKSDKTLRWIKDNNNEFFIHKSPIKHLMLINFLGKSIKEVINDINNDYKPFGIGPWKCINAVCCYQNKNVIKKVELSAHPNPELPELIYGIFKCEHCGFKYSRYLNNYYNGLLHYKEDGTNYRYSIKEILDYGELWYESLKVNIIDKNYRIGKISKIMKCNKNVILSHAKKLNIDNRIRTYRVDEEKLQSYKNQCIEIMNNNPNITRTQLINIIKVKYQHLIKYDKKWWEENAPTIRHKGSKDSKIDKASRVSKVIRDRKDSNESLENSKQQCIALMAANPNINRSSIKKAIRNAYGIILRLDREWWEKNAPPIKRGRPRLKK